MTRHDPSRDDARSGGRSIDSVSRRVYMRLFAAVPLFGTGAAASSADSSRGSTVGANGAGFGTQGYGDGPYGDPEDRTVSDYANDKGIVDTTGLLDAVDDWRNNVIDISLLLDVINAWRSGNQVN